MNTIGERIQDALRRHESGKGSIPWLEQQLRARGLLSSFEHGPSRQSIHQYINNTARPSEETLAAIAKVLDVEPQWLRSGTGPRLAKPQREEREPPPPLPAAPAEMLEEAPSHDTTTAPRGDEITGSEITGSEITGSEITGGEITGGDSERRPTSHVPELRYLPPVVTAVFREAWSRLVEAFPTPDPDGRAHHDSARLLWDLIDLPLHQWGIQRPTDPRRLASYYLSALQAIMLVLPEPGRGESVPVRPLSIPVAQPLDSPPDPHRAPTLTASPPVSD